MTASPFRFFLLPALLRSSACMAALSGALLTAGLVPSPAQASAAVQQLEVGQQKTWSLARPIQRAATANDEIVGINVVPPSGVILTAKKPGSAMVSIWDNSGRSTPASQFQVVVTPAGIAGSSSGVQVSGSGTKLKLSGELRSLEQQSALESATREAGDKPAANVIDTTTSGFDVQVQIDVKIVEVSRSKLMASGFYWRSGYGSRTSGVSGPNNLSGFESSQSEGRTLLSASGFLPRSDTFNIFTWSSNALAVFSALESNGFAYTVAEPSLTALSGQTATFLAGGELPIPMRTGSGSDSAVSVKFKEFGIRLGLAPTVLDQQRIALKVAPEVSEIDPALAVEIGGFNIPGLRVRRTETTVALGDGETFVISGLVSRESIGSIDKFPFLGDIPVLGAFFKSNRIERNDKELLMIVTPRLVRPFSAKAKLPDMPGEELKRYDPGFLHMLLMERGRFDGSESGFSQ
jgi:pilus assembly protein CpaC